MASKTTGPNEESESESVTVSFKIARGLCDELDEFIKETNLAKNRSELINHLIWQLIEDHKKYKLMAESKQEFPQSEPNATKQPMPINTKRATKKTE